MVDVRGMSRVPDITIIIRDDTGRDGEVRVKRDGVAVP